MIDQVSALKLILLVSSFLVINNNSVTAQITPDNTLGAESSRVVPNGVIDKIDGGALRDRNLFHSFKEFNINNGQSVYFSNPSGIENILTRVTGGNASNILGTLGVDGAANLFLINPNGILFGENARLDVQGSFVGTTANGLQFGEQGNFSATNPQAPGLLTVNPNALFFNQLQGNEGIINKSQANAGINPNGIETTGLRVPDGKSLLLVGGNINLDGGSLRAYEGNVELASVAAPGSIGLDISGDTFGLNVPEDVERGDISLANESYISVFGAGGRNLVINARNLDISNSGIFSGIGKNSENPDAQAGDVNINATDSILIKDGAFIDNSVYSQGNAGDIFLKASNSVSLANGYILNNIEAGGIGKGGNINITAGSLSLNDGSEIQTILGNTDINNNLPGGQGNAGNIDINVRDAVTIAGIKDGISSDIFSFVGIDATGNAGDININTGSLSLAEASEINAKTLGQGNAGNITVNARQNISLDGSGDVILSDGSNGTISTRIINSVDPDAVGNSGNIQLNTGILSVTNEAFISNSISGKGEAGNITINARDTVAFVDSIIANNIEAGGVGNGGNINITAGSLSLTDGSEIQALLRDADVENNLPGGQGDAGNININVRDAVTISGIKDGFNSDIYSFVGIGAIGNAGDININTGSLTLAEGSEINTKTSGEGNAGNITVNARQNISLDGSGDVTLRDGSNGTLFTRIISSVDPEGVGNGGDIQLNTGNLSVTNRAFISSGINGKGDGGNITINALDNIIFNTGSFASSSVTSDAVGNGGDIRVTTGTLSLTNGSRLSTNVLGEGNAGNIFVEARESVKLDGVVGNAISGILSDSLSVGVGKGGDIQITTGLLSVTNGAAISAFTGGRGDAGNITINARDQVTFDGFDASSGLISIVTTFADSKSVGNGGDIRITTGELLLKNGGNISSNNFGKGNSGNIFLDVGDTITFDGKTSGKFTIPSSANSTVFNGNAGNIEVKTGSLFLTDGGLINAAGTPQQSSNNIANAGNITINARDTIKFDGLNSGLVTILLRGTGKGGDIQITTGSLSVTNDSSLVSFASGEGDAGNININARDTITFEQGAASTEVANAIGDGGDIEITTGSLFLDNRSLLATLTNGQGDAGNIKINTRDTVTFDRESSAITSVGSNGIGKGGDIEITTGSLFLDNGGLFSTGTSGKGDAGKVKIDAVDSISLSNSSSIRSSVFSGGEGKGGEIDLDTQTLKLIDGSQILANVFREFSNLPGGKGRGGDININASESVNLSGISSTGFSGGIATLTERGASGDAGNITVTTGNFRITDAAIVTAATFNDSNTGKITINANTFEAINGGQVVNTTRSSGNAGTITVNVKDRVTITGTDPNFTNRLALVEEQIKSPDSTDIISDVLITEGSASGLFAGTSAASTGKGGSIFIDPRLVIIENGAAVSVGSNGTGDAGDIFLQAGTLQLDNGFITAQTASTQGGDISLNLSEKLLLRNNSQISTTAGNQQFGGNGGNITINSPFIVALPKENSDITANAFTGNGGNVDIFTQGIFGIQPRSQTTNQSDITTSSETGIQGEISVTDPEINPTQGLIELPDGVVDKSTQIAQICPRGVNAKRLSEFYITGRGNLPPNPLDMLTGTVELSRLATLDGESVAGVRGGRGGRKEQESQEVVEARGFMKTENGEIYLVAQAPLTTSYSGATASVCPL